MLNLEGEEEGGLVGQGVEGKDEEEGEETLEDRLVAALAAEVVRLGAREGEGGRPARGVLRARRVREGSSPSGTGVKNA
jgi:hypothetical protein